MSNFRGGAKPVDVGNGSVCASFSAGGAWLSLGAIHAQRGFIELTGLEPFDEALRGQAEAVRRYRARLTEEGGAFLTLVDLPAGAQLSFEVTAPAAAPVISQRLRINLRGAGAAMPRVGLRFTGRLSPPALAMITETARRPAAGQPVLELRALGARLLLYAAELRSKAVIRVEGASPAGWQLAGGQARIEFDWPAGASAIELLVECELDTAAATLTPATARPRSPLALPPLAEPAQMEVPTELWPALETIRGRALDYVRGCTALRVGPNRVAIVTDHRLLPLSWTRDAYFQALLLLRAGEAALVADHLRWLWLDCDRPTGSWARSHQANGARWDDVYQADQQLFPLIELADYARATGHLPSLPARSSWSSLIAPVLEQLLGRLSRDGLLSTEENAADDPAELPFLLANQVLAVHALERVAPLASDLGLGHDLIGGAAALRAATRREFATADGPWAYAVDRLGNSLLYHDANDVATAFAPLLGFCPADDPPWRTTMRFAFSPANEAYVAGPFGGLGSRHTPGVWSLGLIQEWVACSLIGERGAAHEALRRLVACAMWDGSLPEASSPTDAGVMARHWFAWPGALLAALLPSRPG